MYLRFNLSIKYDLGQFENSTQQKCEELRYYIDIETQFDSLSHSKMQ